MEETVGREILEANERIVELVIAKKDLSNELEHTHNELEKEIERFSKLVKRVDDLLSVPSTLGPEY